MMVGRRVKLQIDRPVCPQGERKLHVTGLTCVSREGVTKLSNVCFWSATVGNRDSNPSTVSPSVVSAPMRWSAMCLTLSARSKSLVFQSTLRPVWDSISRSINSWTA